MAGAEISARRRASERVLAKTAERRKKQERIEAAMQAFFLLEDEAASDRAELKDALEKLAGLEKLRERVSELQERESGRVLEQAGQVKVLLEEGQTQGEMIELLEISRGELRKLLDALPQQPQKKTEAPPAAAPAPVEPEVVEVVTEAAPVAS
ncbi:Uncharacterised protein [Mycobacteroides abscessus subsp. abscessus]|uniref:hypothetical protein n=1 Tax=Mycobacteroides abscessus TaxID=36809 RepID=UPI00092BB388|nr:hypothetical protein [Mycobacteroides abscessus]SHQ44874.1 Uncharacterised protein [Mycobacteroides abscessus subsp. abscessus]SHQ52418.1 Uncharacterised protein [Mycobacteroides abscessus subsp. abscessus]SLL30513.1 Uncharacterised protein [Mycobacteroides abscessus subsp. abscessus]